MRLRPEPSGSGLSAIALTLVCMGNFLVAFDASALNVALPSMRADLHTGQVALQWVLDGYTIPLAGVLLTAGVLGDRFGSRRVFVLAMATFGLTSLVCALSPGISLLVAARCLQGVSAGVMLPMTLAIISRSFESPAARTKAIGTWGMTGGVALVSGPFLGGQFCQLWGWQSVFLINVPIVTVSIVLALRTIRETSRHLDRGLDFPGQISAVVALICLTAGLIEAGRAGSSASIVTALLVVALLAGALFVLIEMRTAAPMLPPGIFRRVSYRAAVLGGFAFQLAGYGMLFLLSVFVQASWGKEAGAAGLLMLPCTVMWFVGTILTRLLSARFGPRKLLIAGGVLGTVGSAVVIFCGDAATWPLLVLGTGLAGVGAGLTAPSISAAAMLSVDQHYAGLGSGVLNTGRQVGMAVGVAILGALSGVAGMRWGMGLIGAGFFAVAALSAAYLRSLGEEPVTVVAVEAAETTP